MTISPCRISLCQRKDSVVFRVEGPATRNQSTAVRLFAEKCLEADRVEIRFHLGDCTYMDSTFLGTLLCLSRLLARLGKGMLSLISPSAECQRLLEQMGIREMLPAMDTPEALEGPWISLSEGLCDLDSSDLDSQFRTVVEAHQELASLPGPAGEQFKAVADGLASEYLKK
jgi:anti-anti-sigma factor